MNKAQLERNFRIGQVMELLTSKEVVEDSSKTIIEVMDKFCVSRMVAKDYISIAEARMGRI